MSTLFLTTIPRYGMTLTVRVRGSRDSSNKTTLWYSASFSTICGSAGLEPTIPQVRLRKFSSGMVGKNPGRGDIQGRATTNGKGDSAIDSKPLNPEGSGLSRGKGKSRPPSASWSL
jgi:hypothetical protein